MDSRKKKRFILAFDSLSGLTAGSLTWLLAPFLQSIHEWTPDFAHFIALGNFGYGLYSGTVFFLFRKFPQAPLLPVTALIAGNFAWALQCLFQIWRLRAEASYLGLGHLFFEAVYVGLVAYAEARIFFPPRVLERVEK